MHAQMDFVKIGIMAGKGATKGAKVKNTIYLYPWLASNLRTIAKCWYYSYTATKQYHYTSTPALRMHVYITM